MPFLLSVLAWAFLQQDDASVRARDLIGKLGSDDVRERVEAERKLLELGRAALPELRASVDLDSNRLPIVRHLIWRVTLGPTLVAKVKKALPEFQETAAWEKDATWTQLFLEATRGRTDDEGPGAFRPWDLEIFFESSLRGAKDVSEGNEVLSGACGYRVHGVAPQIAAQLTHADPERRARAILCLRGLGAKEWLPEILKRLDDESDSVREEAFDSAATFRATEATPKLLEFLRDKDPDRRAAAADVLGRIGAREAIGPLMPLLGDKETHPRRKAAEALVRLRAYDRVAQLAAQPKNAAAIDVLAGLEVDEAVPGLRGALKSRHPDRRMWAMQQLEDIHPPGLVDDLVGMMGDKDPGVAHVAVQSLMGLKAREGIPKIVPLLDNPSVRGTALMYVRAVSARETIPYFQGQLKIPERRKEALEVLGGLKATEAIPSILPLLEGEDGELQNAALASLSAMQAPEAAREFLKLLDHQNPYYRTSAASFLGHSGSRDHLPALRQRLAKGEEWDRVFLGEALARLGEPEGFDILRDELKSGQELGRRHACWTLAELKPPGLVPIMKQALKDGDTQVRDSAISYLHETRCREALPDILPFLETEESWYYPSRMIVELNAREAIPAARKLLAQEVPRLRNQIAGMLADLQAGEAIPDLVPLLQDEETAVPALHALGNLGAVDSLAAMKRFLADDDPKLRRAAVAAIAKLGLPETVPDLVKMLRDEDHDVARSAVDALVDLGARSAVPELQRLAARGEEMEEALARLGDSSRLEGFVYTALNSTRDFFLNAVRKPGVWARLEGRVHVRRPEDTKREALERMARAAGLAIEWPPMTPELTGWLLEPQWNIRGYQGDPGAQPRSSLLSALEKSSRDCWCGVVLEDDRIRILDLGSARAFWRDWWKAERRK